MSKQHYIARITWISEGRRKKIPPEGTRYCPIIDLATESDTWSIDFVCPDFEKIDVIEFSFFASNAPDHMIHKGERYDLLEGSKKAAEITIVDICSIQKQ